ncbi:MAG: hypothetical protein RLZZ324_495 [Candidatus Parcubacteria bacterium]|jgi:hypothetical protein
MQAFLSFLLGSGIVAIGVLLIVKTEWFLQNFGSIEWFDEKLGHEGGSRLGYKIVGLTFCFFGILTAFGLFKGFFIATAGQYLLPPNARQ